MIVKKESVFSTRARFNKVNRLGILFFLIGAAVFGCQSLGTSRGSGYDAANRYKTALTHWTRETRIYNDFNLVLSLVATYRSKSFRSAYVDEYSRIYELKAADRKKRLSEQMKTAESAIEFLMAVHVPNRKWDDFDTEDSIWRIYIEAGAGGRKRPQEVTKLNKHDAVIRYFFPYLSPWKSVYRIRFARPGGAADAASDGDSGLKLIVTGVQGKAELRWKASALKTG